MADSETQPVGEEGEEEEVEVELEDLPLHAGTLSIKRKKGDLERYFVLWEESLVFYESQEAAEKGEITGSIFFEDVKEVRGGSGSNEIAIEMSDGKVAIMAAPSEEEHKEWLEALGELPAAKVAAEARVSIFAGRQDWRHSEVVVTQEQYATLVKEHGANFARQKQGGLFGKSKPAGPCEGCGIQNAPKFKGVFKSGDSTICELCYTKALPAPSGKPPAKCTGMLSWRDSKKKWNPFFCVLTGVSLEQHKGPEEYLAGKPVVAQFDLGSAASVTVQDDGTIEVALKGKDPEVFEVCFHAEEGKSAESNRWGKAVQDALVETDVEVIWGARLKREAFMKAKTKTMERLGDKQKEATLGMTRREVAKQEAELEEEGQAEEGAEEGEGEGGAVLEDAEDDEGEEAGEAGEVGEEEGAGQAEQAEEVAAEGGDAPSDAVCSAVGRIDGSTEDHFLVLGKDRLSIYPLDAAPGGQLSSGAKSIGKVRLSSITDWVPLDTGFKLHRSDNIVKVDISSDVKKWHEALWGQLAASKEEIGVEEDLVLDSPGTPIFKGPLLLIEASREAPKIGLLINASLELRELESRAEDALRFAVATLQDAQVSRSGVLTLSFGGKEEASIINVAVPENAEPGMVAWCSALNSLVQACVLDANVRERLSTTLGRSRASLLGQGGGAAGRRSADDDRKIREVFGFCSPDEKGMVSADNLIGACTRSALIQDFFNIQVDPETGLREMTGFISSKGFWSGGKGLDYEEFKSMTLEWQEAHPRSDRPIRKSNLKKSGKGAEVRSSSSPASPSMPRKHKRTEQEQKDKCTELCKTPRRWQENLDALAAQRAAQNSAKKKGQPKLFRINSHHAGHAATSLLVSGNGDVKGGVNVAALTRGMCSFTKPTVSPKVNLHLGSPYPEKPWTDKVTNSARGGYVKPSEETPWKKINRHSTMEQDCSALARGASAPPDQSRKRASCTEKVGQRGPDCLTTRPSTAHLKLGTASKITSQNRDPNYVVKTKSGVDAHISTRETSCLEVKKAVHSGSVQKMKPLGH